MGSVLRRLIAFMGVGFVDPILPASSAQLGAKKTLLAGLTSIVIFGALADGARSGADRDHARPDAARRRAGQDHRDLQSPATALLVLGIAALFYNFGVASSTYSGIRFVGGGGPILPSKPPIYGVEVSPKP